MFSKSKDKDHPSIKRESGSFFKGSTTPSIVSEDLTISGDLVSEGEIQVDGKVEGDIRCRKLLVGEGGSVLGAVNADDVRIHGTVKGEMFARTVFLASTSRMVGDVTHESLAIEPGAYVEGHCRRISDPIPAEQGSSDLMITDARLKKVAGKKNMSLVEDEEDDDKDKKGKKDKSA